MTEVSEKYRPSEVSNCPPGHATLNKLSNGCQWPENGLTRGDRVLVYEDLVRQTKPLGIATLVRICPNAEWMGNSERWLIRLDGSDEITECFVEPSNKVT